MSLELQMRVLDWQHRYIAKPSILSHYLHDMRGRKYNFHWFASSYIKSDLQHISWDDMSEGALAKFTVLEDSKEITIC